MSATDTRTVTAADGTALDVTISGAADAPHTVLLAHGWTLSQRSWDPVVRILRMLAPPEQLRIVSYDQRHHGRSGRGGQAPDIDLLGDDLHRVITEVAPTGPLVLAGHSMGGMTIMALAAQRPELFADRVRGVALVATSAGGPAPQPGPVQRLIAGPLLAAALRHHTTLDLLRRLAPPGLLPHRMMARRIMFGDGTADEVVRTGAELVHATPARTILEFWPALETHDKTAALATLADVPVQILVGSRDRLTPVRRARYLAEHIRGSRLTVLPGYGHMLTLERPELLARTLLSLAGITTSIAR